MRVSSITLCSLITLLAWDVSCVNATTPEKLGKTTSQQIESEDFVVSELNTSKSNVSDTLVKLTVPQRDSLSPQGFSKSRVDIAPPEIIFDHGEKKISQLPNPGEANNPASFPDAEPLDEKEVEEELGEIRYIKPRDVKQPPQPRQPDVQLLLRSSTFSSSNITAVDFLQRSDTVFVNSATLLATPKLGEDTRFVASATGGLTRFATKDEFNYNFLSFNAGIQQRLAPGMYGQLGWVQDRLYNQNNSDRILVDDSVRLTIGRQDQLSKRLRLDSFYDLRASFAEPKAQSRVANSLGARLRYDLTPKLQGALDYRLTLKDYTNQDRFDTQHQVGVDLIYNVNKDLFIGSSASYLFGSSSASSIDLNNFSLGVNIGLNVPLF